MPNNIDHDYLETLGITVTAGCNFSTEYSSDEKGAVLLNEAAVARLGWENPVGRQPDNYGRDEPRTIIGIVKDFHFESLHQPIEPVLLQLTDVFGRPPYNLVTLRIRHQEVTETLAFLETQWAQFAPDQPFEYTFLDATFAEMYETEQRLAQVFGLFAGLAILIACLGLLGLSAFAAEQRTKEIGIRKVMGASS